MHKKLNKIIVMYVYYCIKNFNMYYNGRLIIDEIRPDNMFLDIDTAYTEEELKIIQILENNTGKFRDMPTCISLRDIHSSYFKFEHRNPSICQKRQVINCMRMFEKKELLLIIYNSLLLNKLTIYEFINQDKFKNIQKEYDNYGDFMMHKGKNKIVLNNIIILDYDFVFTNKFTKLIRPDLYEINFDDSFRNKIQENSCTNLFIYFN